MATETTLKDLYTFDATNGTIDPADYTVVEAIVNSGVCAALGVEGTVEPATPMGRLIEWLSLYFTRVLGLNVQNANQMLISAAAGQQLDAMAQWFQLERRASSYSLVDITCYRAEGYEGVVNIPAGSLVRNQNGDVFESLSSGMIPANKDSVTIPFEALDTGPIDVTQNSVNILDSSIAGWGSCNNPSGGTPGADMETDESLRDRIQASRTVAPGFIGAIKNAVEAVVGNGSAMVLENSTNANLDVHGVNMEPHSILVCVDGLPAPDTAGANQNETVKAVAKAIFDNKPCGTGYTKEASPYQYQVAVVDPFENEYDVFFCAPIPQPITVAVQVKNRSYTGADIIGDVTKAVESWASESNFKCGEDVFASEVIKAVEEKVPGVIVVTCTVSEGGADKGTSYAEIDAIHKAKLEPPIVNQFVR